MQAIVALSRWVDAVIVSRSVLKAFNTSSLVLSKRLCRDRSAFTAEDEIAPSPAELPPADLGKIPTNQQPPKPPTVLNIAEAFENWLEPPWLDADWYHGATWDRFGMSGRKVAKRACDGCKIRKIKCTEVSPCEGCIAAGIACTFVKHPQTRGPRRLRTSTLQEIAQTQQQWADTGLTAEAIAPSNGAAEANPESAFAPSQIASLVLQLCVYRLRMYPVWPIIKVERLVAALQKPDPDIEIFALAYAVAAATIAQIKPAPSSRPESVTAGMMELRCQHARTGCNKRADPNITTLRIAFFLHVYYENQMPGGLQSILYLREAITMSQMIGLHRESYYVNVAPEEQQIRRRTFWLLFVTERGVSVLHKLPVILRTRIAFPNTDDTDEADVLIAFRKLVSLFWTFDQSGVFEILDRADFDTSSLDNLDASDPKMLESLSQSLAGHTLQTEPMNDIQAVDIALTRQWMRVILWRLTQSHGIFATSSSKRDASLYDPVQIAKEFLTVVSHMPRTAIEAHGPGLELKVFEIASSVLDALILGSKDTLKSDLAQLKTSQGVLGQLRKFLIRNKRLDAMLGERIAKAEENQHWKSDFNQSDSARILGPDIQEKLQSHGFDFSQPLRASASSYTESTTSDISNHSPVPAQNQLTPVLNRSPFGHQSQNWAQQHKPDQQTQGQNAAWDASLQPSPGTGFSMTQDLFNQLQGFHQDLDALGMDISLDSSECHSSGWAEESSGTNQLAQMSPIISWQQAQNGFFDH